MAIDNGQPRCNCHLRQIRRAIHARYYRPCMICPVKIPRSLVCPMNFTTTSRNCCVRLFNRPGICRTASLSARI